MKIEHFFEKATSTLSYIVIDESTLHCAIIDSVLDYEPESGKTSTQSADQLIAYIEKHQLKLQWILETHLHADHLTAANYLRKRLGGKIGIGANIKKVIPHWTNVFNISTNIAPDTSCFDKLFEENEIFHIGNIPVKVLNTPGHTPVCVSYLVEDMLFVGDVIFMPNIGTARTDFPGADAKTLYHSIQKIFALPDSTRLLTCHDYPPEGMELRYESTVGEQKKNNILIKHSISESEYIQQRNARDLSKPLPRLLFPAIQVNLRAGDLGPPEENGVQYIKIPLNFSLTP